MTCFISIRRRHTSGALVTVVQMCALPIVPQATVWDMRLPGTIRLMSVMVESSASVALPLLLTAVRPHNTRNDARTSGQFKDKGGTLFREQQDSMNASIGNARHPSPY